MAERKPKILLLSTFDIDGGATAWLLNFAKVLINNDYQVAMAVKQKTSNYSFVYKIPAPPRPKSRIKCFWLKYITQRQRDISRDQVGEYGFFYKGLETSSVYRAEDIVSTIPFVPDVIIMSLTNDFVNTCTLRNLQHIWGETMRVMLIGYDMNAFTGGCHILMGCEGFANKCMSCPAFESKSRQKEVEESYVLKMKNVREGNMGVLYTSAYSAMICSKSLFATQPQYDLGMCIDTHFFTNENRDIAKRIFNLPLKSKVVFAGSEDLNATRKGAKYFFEALKVLWDNLSEKEKENTYILLVGKNKETLKPYLSTLPPYHFQYIDFITDYRLLSLAYQAADIFVCPTIDDAGPMMVAEALSCGTPVVGFKMGLMYDQTYVQDGITGYVVELKNVEQLANAILKILRLNVKEYDSMSKRCRQLAIDKLSVEHTIDLMSHFTCKK